MSHLREWERLPLSPCWAITQDIAKKTESTDPLSSPSLCHTLCLLSMGISQRVFWLLQTKLCVLTHAKEINPTYLQSLHYISVPVGCPFPSSWKLGPLQRMAGTRGAHRALLTSVWKHPADAGHAAALHSSCGCSSGLGTAVQWLNKLLIACAVPWRRSPVWKSFT